MLKRKTALAALAMAGAVWGGSTQIAQAQSTCNVATAKQSLKPEVLCECKVVTTQMLRYIQRQDEFLTVLANVTEECPAFANALNALPTATVVPTRTPRDRDDGLDGFSTTGPDDDDKPKKPDDKPKKPDRKPKDKPDDKPGGNPGGGGGGDEPGDNPEGGGGGDNPGDNPEGGGGGDNPGDNPSPEGCGGGGDGKAKSRAREGGCN